MSYCDMYGELAYPYGYTLHYIMELLAVEYQADQDRWYIKAGSTVTNQYGAEAKTNTECYITGSNEQPVVVDFVVY